MSAASMPSDDAADSPISSVSIVLRSGGTVVYTLRHTGDAHYGTGIAHGYDMFENGAFIAHFFDDALVRQLSEGFELIDVVPFTEGDLPRKLWHVTMRKPGGTTGTSPRRVAGEQR